jgi:outer membrane protein TolC
MPKTSSFLLPLVFLSLLSVVAPAQGRQSLNLSFEQAVELALKNYPAVRAAQAQRQAAEAGVDLARANYLPRVDMAWQQRPKLNALKRSPGPFARWSPINCAPALTPLARRPARPPRETI